MKNNKSFVIGLLAVLIMSLCLLVYHASHSTDEMVRRRAVIAYYHFMRCSAERREAARYLLDNMPYHYGYGVTVHDSKEVKPGQRRLQRPCATCGMSMGYIRFPATPSAPSVTSAVPTASPCNASTRRYSRSSPLPWTAAR